MKHLLLTAMISLASVSIVQAQTHPCDVALPNNPQLTSPVKAGFCHSGKDVDGNSTIITSFRVKFDGVDVFMGPLTAIGTPNAAGLSYFETPTIVVSRGNHSSTMTAISAEGESTPTSPYPFVLVGSLPAPATVLRIKK